MHLKALGEASKAVKASRDKAKLPKSTIKKTVFECLEENKAKIKHLDPIDQKRKCPHPATGFICQLCEYEKVPKEIMKNAINYGKSPSRDNEGLKSLREAYKFEKSPRN